MNKILFVSESTDVVSAVLTIFKTEKKVLKKLNKLCSSFCLSETKKFLSCEEAISCAPPEFHDCVEETWHSTPQDYTTIT